MATQLIDDRDDKVVRVRWGKEMVEVFMALYSPIAARWMHLLERTTRS
jgi:hypothetical protein